MIYSDPRAFSHAKHLKDRAKEGILFNNVILLEPPRASLTEANQKCSCRIHMKR